MHLSWSQIDDFIGLNTLYDLFDNDNFTGYHIDRTNLMKYKCFFYDEESMVEPLEFAEFSTLYNAIEACERRYASSVLQARETST